jgi:hypothetical protein
LKAREPASTGKGKGMVRDSLMQTIVAEVMRVWPEDSFEGTDDQYAWLYEHYGITEQDDVKWQCALADWMDEDPDLDLTDPADRELMTFLTDEGAMQSFLVQLREQYRRGSAVWGAEERA